MVDPPNQRLRQRLERRMQGIPVCHHHIVMPRFHIKPCANTHGFLQASSHPVAFNRIALALSDRITDARCFISRSAIQHFQNEIGATPPFATANGKEFGPSGQPSGCWCRPVRHRCLFGDCARSRSGGKTLASARSAGCQNLAAAFGGEACAEAVAALAHKFGRLKGTLCHLFKCRGVRPFFGLLQNSCVAIVVRPAALFISGAKIPCPNVRGLYAESPDQVNSIGPYLAD